MPNKFHEKDNSRDSETHPAQKVKQLSNALKWEQYAKNSPSFYPGKQKMLDRARQAQKDIVK